MMKNSSYIICRRFTDLHTHLREPGQNHKETVETASEAAFWGGYGTLVAMPNTSPAIDNPQTWTQFNEECQKRSKLEIIQTAAISMKREGCELTDFAALKDAGVIALSDDGSTPQSDDLMLKAAELASKLDLPIIDHCEDFSLSKPGVMHLGAWSRHLNLPGQPREAEERIVKRDIEIASKTGCHMHLQHLSSSGSIKLLREAKQAGIPVTGEVTPHHLAFTDEIVHRIGSNAKMAPPLREEKDRMELIQGVFDGIIDCIATDHAPHTAEEKSTGMINAPFGIIGLEYAFQVAHEILCVQNGLPIERLLALFDHAPRNILHLKSQPPLGMIKIDFSQEYVIDIKSGHSKSSNCPYDGFVTHCRITPVS